MHRDKEIGRLFAPKIECSTNYKDGVWFGTICIGEEYYYETDRNSLKHHVIENMIGCLESIRDKIDKKLDELKKKEE